VLPIEVAVVLRWLLEWWWFETIRS